jgi:cytoskeletal protein CcmA (bactofilin family)
LLINEYMGMFSTQDKGAEPTRPTAGASEDTIIGKTIKIEGDLVSNGDIIVEGEVVGSLKTDKNLRVGQGAKVSADVRALTALVAGEVSGNLEILDSIELTPTAKVTGDIKAKVVTIQPGAAFNGRCTMDAGTPVTVAAKAQQKAV